MNFLEEMNILGYFITTVLILLGIGLPCSLFFMETLNITIIIMAIGGAILSIMAIPQVWKSMKILSKYNKI